MLVEYGQKIKVGNGSLNVYSEGNGTPTIVILSGAGVTSPVLEYRPLYRKLSDIYRIVVIEKSGYGMSESTGTERSVQNIHTLVLRLFIGQILLQRKSLLF